MCKIYKVNFRPINYKARFSFKPLYFYVQAENVPAAMEIASDHLVTVANSDRYKISTVKEINVLK